MILLYITLANILVSLISLSGFFLLAFLKEEKLNNILLFLVSLSAGALLGDVFIHILPEAVNKGNNDNLFLIVLFSMALFFIIEKVFHWRHCHEGRCEVHSFGYMNLLGDFIHNFIDGVLIASTFVVDIKLGVITTFAILLHELPQEMGDFAVLLYSGIKKDKVLLLNYLVSLSSVAGGIFGFYLTGLGGNIISILLPIAAGNFLYISTTDLIPEIKNEKNLKRSRIAFVWFLVGVLMMYALKMLKI